MPRSSSGPKSPPVQKTSPRQAAKSAREAAEATARQLQQFNLKAAAGLKPAVLEALRKVRFAKPLDAADAPRPAKGGALVAPNGDALIRVKLSEERSAAGAWGLINPRTNQFYKEENAGGTVHFYGPLSLPRGAQLKEKDHSPEELRDLERAAGTSKRPPKAFNKAALLVVLTRLINRGEAGFDGQAVPREDVLSEAVLKKDHPFTYSAVIRKDDPARVIIKKLMTGGFLPPGPSDGSWSQPITLEAPPHRS